MRDLKAIPVTSLPGLHCITIRTGFNGRWYATEQGKNVPLASSPTLGGLLAELTKIMKDKG